VALGILKGDPKKLIKDKGYIKYYMHRTGHWIGMDVHDVGDYKLDGEWRMLEPGMVMTVEPGLYMPAGSPGLSKKWWNIGIRIEDDVLVTKGGYEVLSRDAVKQADEIEKIMTNVA
jgi:Xaa-Pro aminopeptidase